MVNFGTWHLLLDLLPLAGLSLILLSAMWIAGIRPETKLANSVKTFAKKMRASVESKWLQWRERFKSLRIAWPTADVRMKGLAISVALILSHAAAAYIGYLQHVSDEFHSTYVLTNAVVDAQNGDYVTYHFEDDPTREPYSLNFTCSHWKPHFKPRQIIAKMTYARKEDCESLDGPQYVLKLRRMNGVPILETEN